MTNSVNYTIDLTPENADKIDKINAILLGDKYVAPSTEVVTEITVPETTATEESADEPMTLKQFQAKARKAKADHGDEFANAVLDELGVKEASSLGRRLSSIDASEYEGIVATWETGQLTNDNLEGEHDDRELDDDEDDDGLDDVEVTPEAVETALRAYAKSAGRDAAKELMKANGAAKLSEVTDCSPKQLAAMLKGTIVAEEDEL